MIAPIDRTSEFLAALAAHNPLSKNTALIKPPSNNLSHPLTDVALQLKSKIDDMRAFIQRCRRRYDDFSPRGMTDVERDEVDTAVAQFLREAMAQIEGLKREAAEGVAREKGASFPAHQLGVVVILNEDLQEVGKLSEGLRGVRIKHAMAERGKGKVVYNTQVAKEMAEERRVEESRREEGEEVENYALLEQEFRRENATLIRELVETREEVREAERTVFEIASLNHVFATKVSEQAREIEVLYELAVEATEFVDRGNRELRKMRKRGPILKYALAGLALFLGIMLLVQEWINRRMLFFL